MHAHIGLYGGHRTKGHARTAMLLITDNPRNPSQLSYRLKLLSKVYFILFLENIIVRCGGGAGFAAPVKKF